MKTKILIVCAMLVAVFMGGYLAIKSNQALGSVAVGGEYHSTSTLNMGSSTHKVIGLRDPSHALAQSSTSLSTLGNVIISSPSTVAFKLWDATSTTDGASTTIVGFGAAPAVGITHIFDVALKRGLIIELPTGFDGETVVTYR